MTENRPKIMVVDDDQGMRITLEGIFEEKGYAVVGAADGYQAIDLARETPFALIFMDIKMPGINGVDTYRQIKRIRPESVVVMMTGFSVEELVKEALNEGAYTIIYKPFDMDRINDIILAVLKPTSVLVVDDRATDRETLRAVLEDGGYAVTEAQDGKQAMAKVAERHYELILMDIGLPGMDGFSTLKEIHEIDPLAKVIFISGYALEDKNLEALIGGAHTVLTKPMDPEDLLDLMRSVVPQEARR